MLGLTFGGRIVCGFSYVLEYCPPEYHEAITIVILISESVSTILIALWYRYADRSWQGLHITLFVISVLTGLWYIVMVPESPKWLAINEYFDRARSNLQYIAAFNAMPASR